MSVISVDYRRAPEHQFPAALNDGYEAYQWIKAHAGELCIDKSRIILAGTSAGANLIASLAIKLRDESADDGILGQLLNIPAVCHPDHFQFPSYEENEDAPTINGRSMRWFWRQYCPSMGESPLASPLLATDHTSLPPAFIQVAELDALRDEGMAYAQALERAGVHVTLKTYPGLPHGFVLAVHMKVVGTYYMSMVEWVHDRLRGVDAT
jgi:acetyl esterase/lipase